MRCAWHPKYHGFPWFYGVASWRGQGVMFSDGMCRWCAHRWRAELHAGRFNLLPTEPEPGPPAMVPAWMPRVGVALALTAAVILAARPLDPAVRTRSLASAAKPPAAAAAPPVTPAAFVTPPASVTSPRCGHDDRARTVATARTGQRARASRDVRPASMVSRARVVPAAAACPRPATFARPMGFDGARCDAPATAVAVSARPARLAVSSLEAP